MKCVNVYLFALLGFVLLMSCSDDEAMNDAVILDLDPYLPFFDLGGNLTCDSSIGEASITVVIDSLNNYSFNLVSTNFTSDKASGSFIKINLENVENVKMLNRLSPGGNTFEGRLQNVFENDESILFDVDDEGTFDWFPRSGMDVHNTGWIKYHAYAPNQGALTENFEEGENFIVFKFGEVGSEYMGWINLVYEINQCHIKEAYYTTNPNEDIIIGEK